MVLTPDHLLSDRSPNIGPLISCWELDKFKNCRYKSFRTSKILTLLYQQFSNLLISQRDMSGPRLEALSNNGWSRGNVKQAYSHPNLLSLDKNQVLDDLGAPLRRMLGQNGWKKYFRSTLIKRFQITTIYTWKYPTEISSGAWFGNCPTIWGLRVVWKVSFRFFLCLLLNRYCITVTFCLCMK
jgi:hypothetical protein